MSASLLPDRRTWTIAEAKARLSELLRLVREEGPQYIGTKKSVVVISEEEWLSLKRPKKPLGLWLIENMPKLGISVKGFLLDTNVISELVKSAPNRNVVEFLSTLDTAWFSIISLHEITYGLELLPQGKRRSILEEKLQQLFSEYSDSVIPIDQPEANQAALFRVQAKHRGRIIHLADALIAGTAKAHTLPAMESEREGW